MQHTNEQQIQDYLEILASKAPVPGGGGASALAGALGTALGEMVSNLTIGKKRYAEVEEEIKELLGVLTDIRAEFLRLADEDARVFAPLADAYGLAAGTEEEKSRKEAVMEGCLLEASLVPIAIMEQVMKMLNILEILCQKGSRMAVSDVGVAVQYARCALLGAVMNVFINTRSMKNREKAEELNAYAEKMIADGTAKADKIYAAVLAALK